MANVDMTASQMLAALNRLGDLLQWPEPVEILLIGGAAGMATGLLDPGRTTGDCDVADLSPGQAAGALEQAARQVARERSLASNWLNDRAGQLNVLPDGWRSRRCPIGTYGQLRVFAASRLDLLATNVFAHRGADRDDVAAMHIVPDEIKFVRRYLNMLRVPSRGADLDQVQQATRYLDLLSKGIQ